VWVVPRWVGLLIYINVCVCIQCVCVGYCITMTNVCVYNVCQCVCLLMCNVCVSYTPCAVWLCPTPMMMMMMMMRI